MNWKTLPLGLLLLAGTACSGGASLGPAARFEAPVTLERQSLDSGGAQADGASTRTRLAGTGGAVAFESLATNLVLGDTNGVSDVFLRDRWSRRTLRVSVSGVGNQADGASTGPAPNGDVSRVAFTSAATNLVPGDTNGVDDVFLRDLAGGATVRLSTDSGGNQANGASGQAHLSSDGNLAAFASDATNLVAGDTNGVADVFVKNRVTGLVERASVDSGGLEANGPSSEPCLSADGRYVAFSSLATNLVPGDTNGVADIFLRDLSTGTTTRVSVDSAGLQADGASLRPSLSGTGAFVAFDSAATNLVAGDTNGVRDVFLRAVETGTTTRLSVDSAGAQADGDSLAPSLNLPGTAIAFHSVATNLVAGDTNGVADVFLKLPGTGATSRLSVSVSGLQADGPSTFASLSDSGFSAAFQSLATNLVPADTNGVSDSFATPIR